MVQATAATRPTAPRAAARGEGAAAELDGAATRQADGQRPAGREVPACTDPARSPQEIERLVHGERLDNAVEVEPNPDRQPKELLVGPDGTPSLPTCVHEHKWTCGVELHEVAVVPGRLELRAERRVDEAGRLRGGVERDGEHAGKERRHGDGPPGGGVDGVELAGRHEATEDRVVVPEERLDGRSLPLRRAADDDRATHRLEAVHGHESAVTASSGAVAGARIPARSRSSFTVRRKSSGASSGRARCFECPE